MNRANTKLPSLLFTMLLTSFAYGLFSMASAVRFGPPQSYLVQQGPAGIAVADFDGDGKVDLVVPNVMEGSISILLGKGDGTFSPAKNYQIIDDSGTPQGTVAVVAADFNRDRKMDLAVVNGSRQTVDVLLGNGDGTFGRAAVLKFPDNPFALVVGDFNGDGIKDLAVTSVESPDYTKPGKVSVFLGNGNGTFREPPKITLVGMNPYSIAVADFNEDGKLDLVVTSNDRNNPKRVQVLFGIGDGTFRQPLIVPDEGNSWAVAVGKFDTSRHMGFAGLGQFSGVTLFIGDGRGGFKAWSGQGTQQGVHSLAVADFNHDGLDDVAIGTPANSVEVMLADGTGHLLPGTTYPLGSVSGSGLPNWELVAADLNRDGYPDLVSTNITSDPHKHFIAVAINQH